MLSRRRHEGPSLDLPAFADIAFLLIVFFILTTTFVKTAGSRLDIPSGAEGKGESEKKNLTISLSARDIRYGEKGERVTLDELRARLLAQDFAARDESDRIVILDAAPDVSYQDYFQVVMAIAGTDGVLALIETKEGVR